MKSTWSERIQTTLGLCLALAIGAGLVSWRLNDEESRLSRWSAERAAVARLGAVMQLVERADGDEETVRTIARRMTDRDPDVASIRVGRLAGSTIEASTAPGDTGERAAPRRMAPDEKPFSDQGQRLRAAVQTNREEGSTRKLEIETGPSAEGGLIVAGPIEEEGAVAGLVELTTPPLPRAPGPSWGALAAIVLVPVIAFFALALLIGERKGILAAVAVVILAATLFYQFRTGASALENERRTVETGVTADLGRVSEVAEEIAGATPALTAAGPLDPLAWDMDSWRRPLGFQERGGGVDQVKLSAAVAASASWFRRVLSGAGLAALVVLAFVGLGYARRLVVTFVQFRHAYYYALPAMAGMLVLVFLPFSYGILLSFTDSTIYNTDKSIADIWVGLANFREILFNFDLFRRTPEGLLVNYSNFYYTLFVTVVWTVCNVTIGVVVGLALALILNRKGLALKPLYRVLLILPWAMPNYITALIWKGMFHQQFGVINQMIQMLGGSAVSWFERPLTSFITVLATNGWLSFPFMMVISLGALQSIPADLYEAARVDGASRWQQFRFITLPSLKPALVPAIILSVIWTFNMFNIIYLVSQGEPGGSTEILITQSYKLAFEQYRYGYAAAYSTVIFLILLAYGTWQNRVTRATEGI